MIKLFKIFVLNIAWTSLFGQVIKFSDSWTSENNQKIYTESIDDRKNENTRICIANKFGIEKCFSNCVSKNDSLILTNISIFQSENDLFILKIKVLNDTMLILKPLNMETRDFFQEYNSIIFKPQRYFIDSTINFDKINFSKIAYRDYSYSLNIYNNNKYKLEVSYNDYITKAVVKTKNEFLNEKQSNELKLLLSTSLIKKTENKGEVFYHHSKYYIMLFENKGSFIVEFYKTPRNLFKLMNFIELFIENSSLKN